MPMRQFTRGNRVSKIAGLVIAFSCATVGTAGAQEIQLKLDRPSKVGDKSYHEVTQTTTSSKQLSMPAMAIQLTPEQKAKLANLPPGMKLPPAAAAALAQANGEKPPADPPEVTVKTVKYTIEVLEVDSASGIATKSAVTVDELTSKTGDDEPTTLLSTGTKLIRTETVTPPGQEPTGPMSNFTNADGSSIAPTAKAALALLITPHYGHTADDLLAIKDPHKPGDTWPVDSKAFCDGFKSQDATLTPDQIKGETKFVKVDDVDGVKSAFLEVHVTISDLKPRTLPVGANVKKSQVELMKSGSIPVDPNVLPVGTSNSTTHMMLDVEQQSHGHTAQMSTDTLTKTVEKISSAK